MRTFLSILAIALLISSAVCADEFIPIYAALQTSPPPHIDGVLDDACWQTAERTIPLTLLSSGKEVDVKTRGMVCRDKDNLYIAVICSEPLMPEIEMKIADKTLQPMSEEVEIFIDPHHDHYNFLQFQVDVLGNRNSLKADYKLDPVLNAKWSAAVSRNTDGWTIEVAMPINIAGTAPPSTKTVWGLNFNRQRLIDPMNKWTCWSDTWGVFYSPPRFGHLIFVDYSTWLHDYFENEIASVEVEFDELSKFYPMLAASMSSQISKPEQSYKDFLQAVSKEKIDTGAKCTSFISMGKSCIDQYAKAVSDLRLLIIENEFQDRRP